MSSVAIRAVTYLNSATSVLGSAFWSRLRRCGVCLRPNDGRQRRLATDKGVGKRLQEP
jgi:hypothetical protein